jgi:serine/threonine protein kinase
VIKTVSVEKKFIGFRAMSSVSQSGYLPTFLPAMHTPVGTPLHVAPELAKQLPFNEKADIYSFGLLIWESKSFF